MSTEKLEKYADGVSMLNMKKTKLPPEALEYFRKQGAIGAKRAAEVMTPEQRKEVAKRAAAARWRNKTKPPAS